MVVCVDILKEKFVANCCAKKLQNPETATAFVGSVFSDELSILDQDTALSGPVQQYRKQDEQDETHYHGTTIVCSHALVAFLLPVSMETNSVLQHFILHHRLQ